MATVLGKKGDASITAQQCGIDPKPQMIKLGINIPEHVAPYVETVCYQERQFVRDRFYVEMQGKPFNTSRMED